MKNIKPIALGALVACFALASACTNEILPEFIQHSRKGTVIVFGLDASAPATRTDYSGYIYDDGNNTGNRIGVERINWDSNDHVTIYCNEADGSNKMASYHVTGDESVVENDRPKHKGTLTIDTGSTSLEWGDAATHTFYGMYPSAGSETDVQSGVGMSANVITAVLPAEQGSPTSHTLAERDATLFANSTYLGNMCLAYMSAVTQADKDATSVTLSFLPDVTTFYVTIKNTTGSDMTLNSVTLTSEASVLNGTYTTTLASNGARTYSTPPERSDANSKITFDYKTAVGSGNNTIANNGSVTVAMFARPENITELTLTVETENGISHLPLQDADGNWLIFAGCNKHNLNNLEVPKWVYSLSVDTNPLTFTPYDVSTELLGIKSIKYIDGQPATERFTSWKAQVEVGGTWVDLVDAQSTDREWIHTFPTSASTGTTSFDQYSTKMSDQAVTTHEDRLKTAWLTELETATNNNVQDRIDLSKWNFVSHSLGSRTTANCYIVQGPGQYMFPMVYGNAIDLVCHSTSDNTPSYNPEISGAGVLNQFRNHCRNAVDYAWTYEPYRIMQPWVSRDDQFGQYCTEVGVLYASFKNGKTASEVIKKVTYADHFSYANNKADRFIYFDVDADNISPGNVIIYVKDTNQQDELDSSVHVTAWTWHIWITDQNLGTVTVANSSNSSGFNMQPVNLGWVDGEDGLYYAPRSGVVRLVCVEHPSTFVDVTLNQTEAEKMSFKGSSPYYQWGRKDPLWPGGGMIDDEPHHIYYSVRHPDKLLVGQIGSITPEYDWTDNGYRNLWKAENRRYGDDARTATTGRKTVYDPCPRGYVVCPGTMWDGADNSMTAISDDTGGYYYRYFKAAVSGTSSFFLPASGYINTSNEHRNNHVKGYFWTDAPASLGSVRNSFALNFDLESGVDFVGDDRAHAYSVRCVREDQFTNEGGELAPGPDVADPHGGDPTGNSYTIFFDYSSLVAGTQILSATPRTSAIAEDSRDYVTATPFSVGLGNYVYFGGSLGNDEVDGSIRIGRPGEGSNLTIELDTKGQVNATRITVSCAVNDPATDSGATLDVNGIGAQTVYTTDPGNIAYTYATATPITAITLTTTKAVKIYYIKVEFEPAAP